MFGKKTKYNKIRPKWSIEKPARKSNTTKKIRNKFLWAISTYKQIQKVAIFIRWKIFLILITLGMTGFIIFSLSSPYFSVQHIEIRKRGASTPIDNVQDILNQWQGENLIFLDKKAIKKSLQSKFPEFIQIDIFEKWPNKFIVDIYNDVSLANILDIKTANFYTISIGGVIVANNATEGLPVITVNKFIKPPKIHTRFMSREHLKKIFLIENELQNQLDISLSKREYFAIPREFHATTQDGTILWIDLEEPSIFSQISKLTKVAKKIKLDKRLFRHIDLRIPQRIYWEYLS